MNHFARVTFAIVLASTLGACKNEEIHTVAYFSANPEARIAQLSACELRDDSADDANCRNAKDAELEAARERERAAIESVYGKPSFD